MALLGHRLVAATPCSCIPTGQGGVAELGAGGRPGLGGMLNSSYVIYLFLAVPVAFRSFQGRNQTQAMAVTQATAVTMMDP